MSMIHGEIALHDPGNMSELREMADDIKNKGCMNISTERELSSNDKERLHAPPRNTCVSKTRRLATKEGQIRKPSFLPQGSAASGSGDPGVEAAQADVPPPPLSPPPMPPPAEPFVPDAPELPESAVGAAAGLHQLADAVPRAAPLRRYATPELLQSLVPPPLD